MMLRQSLIQADIQRMIQATTNTKEQEAYKHDEKRTWWKKHGRVCCNEVKDVCIESWRICAVKVKKVC